MSEWVTKEAILMASYHLRVKDDTKSGSKRISAKKHVDYILREDGKSHADYINREGCSHLT